MAVLRLSSSVMYVVLALVEVKGLRVAGVLDLGLPVASIARPGPRLMAMNVLHSASP